MWPTARRSAPKPILTSTCTLASLAFALLLTSSSETVVGRAGKADCAGVQPSSEPAAEPIAEPRINGVWMRYKGRAHGQDIRFWYFHGDGKGLYRYGRVGWTQTHSFDYSLDGQRITLTFRKSGVSHSSTLELGQRVDPDSGRTERWLEFADDPREAGARYHLESMGPQQADHPMAAELQAMAQIRDFDPGVEGSDEQRAAPKSPSNRVWIDFRKHASGGTRFQMYQFNRAGIDGRGIGWYHDGDFDDWSTEALTYRIDSGADRSRIELNFDLAGTHHDSQLRFNPAGNSGERASIVLDRDPRDFWRPHAYFDAGPSFGTR